MDIIRKSTTITKRTTKKQTQIPFIYINKKTKKKIKSKNILKHIHSLKIPPAYTNVSISSKKNNKIQAIGTDTKGRRQYIYNPEYIKLQDTEKFSDLIIFGKKIRRIRADMKRIIRETSLGKRELQSKESLIALVLYLVDNCHFRIGCQKYKLLYKTYGVTTLNNNHFKKINDTLNIEFVGKKGVINSATITNKSICNMFEKLCKQNRGEYLFNSYEDKKKIRITERHISNYLKKYDKNITVKMFRTWKANHILLKEMLQYPLPESINNSKTNVRDIIKKAAEKMHHTRGVSKKSYMNNHIINLYIKTPIRFKNIISSFKQNRNILSIDRMLTLLLQYLKKYNNHL